MHIIIRQETNKTNYNRHLFVELLNVLGTIIVIERTRVDVASVVSIGAKEEMTPALLQQQSSYHHSAIFEDGWQSSVQSTKSQSFRALSFYYQGRRLPYRST